MALEYLVSLKAGVNHIVRKEVKLPAWSADPKHIIMELVA